MSELLSYAPAIASSAGVTILLSVLSILGCAITAVILGVARAGKRAPVRIGGGLIVELLRGASGLVYLFWVYYALPLIPGMPQFAPFTACVLVLSLVGGAYGAEIVSAGIQSIPKGQRDACWALGLSRWRTLTRVILPQALSQIVPSFGSLAVDMVKWTTIASFVGVKDLLYVANNLRNLTYETITIYAGLSVLYLVLSLLTSAFFVGVERVLPLSRAARAASSARASPLALQGG